MYEYRSSITWNPLNDMYMGTIQVRTFLLWHDVATVEDSDIQYVEDRCKEIIDILNKA